MSDSFPPVLRTRRRLRIDGLVQGVGFRPFVYRLASELALAGFVLNDSQGVLVEVEGAPDRVGTFGHRLRAECPPLARIVAIETSELPADGSNGFVIAQSQDARAPQTLISPDVAVCEDCLRELFDPTDRRYRYPFINCTNCGPRFTIVEGVPYDRPLTSMKRFPLCPECGREYHDPASRRFHAQPNACPVCGPSLTLCDRHAKKLDGDPIAETIRLLRAGKIVAIRGVGGFHLVCDPQNEAAVRELRRRKGRAEKPFALMAPDIESIREHCEVSAEEAAALQDYRRPILLLRRKPVSGLSDQVAPANPCFGFMLPYAPLHHLLLRDQFDALIMTSANFSEEPIVIGNSEAMERLAELADYFLLHDREILQRCDDSIARVQDHATRLLRRARGYVPEPVFLSSALHRAILACGAELKNCLALGRDRTVFLSQHIGDLDSPSALGFFEHAAEHLKRIMGITPELIACDLHPEYLSTKWAKQQPMPVMAVQHHHAHLVSVMAEHHVTDPTIGIILDGTGYGTDGSIWGGELLFGDARQFQRLAWLEPVPMPGGTAAIHQPWRMALAYLHHAYGPAFTDLPVPVVQRVPATDRMTVRQMLEQRINSPLTSSCGRLFDGVAALLGLRSTVSFEAQTAMELEYVATGATGATPCLDLDFTTALGPQAVAPLIRALTERLLRGEHPDQLARAFHYELADLFVRAALTARQTTGCNRVALSGGVYQNVLFFDRMLLRLRRESFDVLTHVQVPTNDGGLALGQLVIADSQTRPGE